MRTRKEITKSDQTEPRESNLEGSKFSIGVSMKNSKNIPSKIIFGIGVLLSFALAGQARDLPHSVQNIMVCKQFLNTVLVDELTFPNCQIKYRNPKTKRTVQLGSTAFGQEKRGSAFAYAIKGPLSAQIELLQLASGHDSFPKDYMICNVDGEATVEGRFYSPQSQSKLRSIDLKISADRKSMALKTVNRQGVEHYVDCN